MISKKKEQIIYDELEEVIRILRRAKAQRKLIFLKGVNGYVKAMWKGD